MAMLVDGAMDYELTRYGRRHLYCHTSWTHIGPLADRPDLEVGQKSVLVRHEAEDPEEWFGIYAVDADGTLAPKGDIPATVKDLFTSQ